MGRKKLYHRMGGARQQRRPAPSNRPSSPWPLKYVSMWLVGQTGRCGCCGVSSLGSRLWPSLASISPAELIAVAFKNLDQVAAWEPLIINHRIDGLLGMSLTRGRRPGCSHAVGRASAAVGSGVSGQTWPAGKPQTTERHPSSHAIAVPLHATGASIALLPRTTVDGSPGSGRLSNSASLRTISAFPWRRLPTAFLRRVPFIACLPGSHPATIQSSLGDHVAADPAVFSCHISTRAVNSSSTQASLSPPRHRRSRCLPHVVCGHFITPAIDFAQAAGVMSSGSKAMFTFPIRSTQILWCPCSSSQVRSKALNWSLVGFLARLITNHPVFDGGNLQPLSTCRKSKCSKMLLPPFLCTDINR